MQEEWKDLAEKAEVHVDVIRKLFDAGKKSAKLKKLKVGGPAFVAHAREYMLKNLPKPTVKDDVKVDVKSKKAE